MPYITWALIPGFEKEARENHYDLKKRREPLKIIEIDIVENRRAMLMFLKFSKFNNSAQEFIGKIKPKQQKSF